MNIRSSVYWSMAQRYGAFVVSFITTMIVSRILTPGEVGIYSLAAVVLQLASIFRDFGMYEYLVQEKTVTRRTLANSLAVTMSVAVAIALALWTMSRHIADWYEEPGLKRLVDLLAFNFLIIPLASQSFTMMSREMKFKALFFIHTVSTIIGSIVTVSCAILGFSYMSPAWGTVASTGFSTLVMLVYRPREAWLAPSFRGALPAYRFGFYAMGSSAIGNLAKVIHETVISRVLGFHALGLFSRGYGLLDQFQGTVVAALQRVAMPAFSQARREGSSLVPGYLRATGIVAGVSWPFFGFLAIHAHNVIPLLFGDQWGLAVPIVRIIAAAAGFRGIYHFAHVLLAACGRPEIRMRIYAASTVLYLLMVILAARISLAAVAWAFVGICAVQAIMFHAAIRLLIGISTRSLLASLRPSALVAAAVAIPVAVSELTLFALGISSIFRLAIGSAVATVFFVISMKKIRHPFWEEAMSMLISVRKAVRV